MDPYMFIYTYSFYDAVRGIYKKIASLKLYLARSRRGLKIIPYKYFYFSNVYISRQLPSLLLNNFKTV